MNAQVLKVEFIDGYIHSFALKEGSQLKYEQNYIWLETNESDASGFGEKFIPMCNVRWFGMRLITDVNAQSSPIL